MAKRAGADQIMEARNVDLIDYLESKGETFTKEGNYYRHTEHDSLLIRDNMYAWNSRGEKGHGAIDFAMMYFNMSFPQAVMDLTNGDYRSVEKQTQQEKVEPYKYPKHYEVDSTKELKSYLMEERKIHPKVVQWALKNEYIVQDQKKNIVFPWKNEKGEIVGANRQGTVDMGNGRRFKGVDKHSQQPGGFHFDVGKPEKLIVFEDAIDALSYYSIKQKDVQNARLVSMSGVKPDVITQQVKQMVAEGHQVKQVVLAVDNDKGGHEFVETITSKMRPSDKLVKDDAAKEQFFQVEQPTKKDWNDDLKAKVKKQMARKEIEAEHER
ncbi:DUF3991 and toprim domain-containing protein [Alkalicoccobacillus gibsonii]|uniref:DUF3991 and toprim domain-containing protein n=1 Tax=Alkalicoccobacillus gibsonii TaxID=79881 RepID=UPI001932605B|nr:DUF3991 and toprim domain-containing protein [Alkalicoccobacillus gibsonii]MBM0067946.1 DUF3991 and TOPRIM domain-containing protein [Alkalicoccobacillus gibsonii]